VTIPTGDFGEFADTGWMATGGFSVGVGDSGLSAGVEGFYGENKHETEGESTKPYGAMGFLLYRAGSPESVGPYFYGGAGILVHKFSVDSGEGSSESNFGYEFGAGLDFPFGDSVGAA
jgi:opacity protein-like surface antigen